MRAVRSVGKQRVGPKLSCVLLGDFLHLYIYMTMINMYIYSNIVLLVFLRSLFFLSSSRRCSCATVKYLVGTTEGNTAARRLTSALGKSALSPY